MIGSPKRGRKSLGPLVLISCLSAGMLLPARSALGFEIIQISSTSIESLSFALYNTIDGSDGSPTWNGGMLISAGSSLFPALTTVNGTSQNYAASNLAAFTKFLSANDNPPFTTQLPTGFGAASTSASAATNLPKDGTDLNQQIGVSFNSGTFLQSAASLVPGTAAVSFTSLHADFVNRSTGLGAGVFNGTAGSVISATGNLSHTPGSYIELANQGTITINGVTTNFAIIVGFAYDSNLNLSTFVYGTGATTLSAPDSSGAFSIKDVNNFGNVTVPKGASFLVDSQLTLVSDPGSLIRLSSDLTGLPGSIPTIGSFAEGPPPAGPVVPEPSTLVQIGTAIVLLTGLWGRRRYRRTPLTSLRLPGLFPAFLAGLTTVILGLGAPGTAESGTITVNDLSLPLSATSTGFSSSTVSIDSVKEQVTFVGTYLSTGGFPAPGGSVTYSVVFLDPDGSQSDASELTIAGISPTAAENTSVHLFFQGLVTTPITPGTGVYFIPEPVGYFDVAAYLRSQGAPNVPGDLSVMIASSVPEPASLVMGGMGVLAGLWVVIRRRRRQG